MRSNAHRPPLFTLLIALMTLQLSACVAPDFISFPPQTRGNKIDPDALAQLVPGTSSRADVQSLIGNPTARGTFDDNTWLYISEVTTPIIGGTQNIDDQNVVVMTFDQKGILRSISKRGADDAKDVTFASGATPSPGNNASVFQQLLGNVGRFSAVSTQGIGNGGEAPGGAGPTGKSGY